METVHCFPCGDETLVGVLHEAPGGNRTGVLIIVGGPQYRVGSHRQFVRQARCLAKAGYSAFRFDMRGMGDSTGQTVDFRNSGDDIQSAIDTFLSLSGTVENVVLYGLCDGASSALMFGARHARVSGLVLLNPWVSRDLERSAATLKHYYLKKLFDRQTWKDLLGGKIRVLQSLTGVVETTKNAATAAGGGSFRHAMLEGLSDFKGKVLIILSGNDIVSEEFSDLIGGNRKWNKAIGRRNTRLFRMPEANHTFSKKVWERDIDEALLIWLDEL